MTMSAAARPVRLLEGQAASERAARALSAYFAELDERLEGGFRAELVEAVPPEECTPPHGDFVLVTELGTSAVLGCGGVRVRPDSSGVAELQRMWLVPGVRGEGLGRFLLRSLENRARALGARRVVLSLNRSLSEAMALFRSAGYTSAEPYEENPYVDVFLGKDL
ncbi:GNAT family N-acetyltransferase [Georgenia alba]|uniref:GNAT family N-acetyltransferase n=1 Tax=Georgenia alba TaxID=2233858 RepID=A0ABW2QCE9_9MICO